MTPSLIIQPGLTLTRSQFVETREPGSIALDGYVYGAPWFQFAPGPFRNFNHHEEVDRSCTSATCEQARRAVLLGLFDVFQVKGVPTATLWTNDCDQDVCLASWILMNPHRAAEPLVRTISQVNDLIDMSAGSFPLPHDTDLLGQIRWVFDPYSKARSRLSGMSGEAMHSVVMDVHDRLNRFAMGRADKVPNQGDYKRIGGGRNWSFVQVENQSARFRLISEGVKAAIELYSSDKAPYRYAIWRKSEYVVDFPVKRILAELNQEEGLGEKDGSNIWGGADNVGGSPRKNGSLLKPEIVQAVLDRVLG